MEQDSSPGPLAFKAVVFDLDGVITRTASVHAAAWQEMFNEYLKSRQQRFDETYREFTYEDDYLPYVDGKPRYKGVESFLKSRGIDIPFGEPSDEPDQETVCGLGNRKNVKLREVLKTKGVEVFDSTVDFIKEIKGMDIHVGVASSSKNCKFVLESAGLEHLFETRVDGEVSAELGLQGKPEADIFVEAAKNMGAVPGESIVVEDAVSGVQAGRNGNFGLVLGIARETDPEELKRNGADIVITDFTGVDAAQVDGWFREKNNS